jgi:hypothetical protein
MQQYKRQHQHPLPKQRNSVRFYFILLIILAALGAIYFYLIPFLSSINSNRGSSFDATPDALQIAREAYKERAQHRPTGHDFGGAAIVVQYADGSKPSVYYSDIYEGYDSPPPDTNKTHSERQAWENFILPTLTIMKDHGTVAKASEIDLIIFTQFYPCVPCQSEMRAWQNQARTTAGTSSVFVSVWTLTASFSPLSSDPKKRAQPAITDESAIQEVPVAFDTSLNFSQLLS